MGILNFRQEKEHLEYIKRKLNSRGLKIDTTDDWEVHGPHENMNYQVFIGYGYQNAVPGAKCDCKKGAQRTDCEAHKQYYCVAIYPRRVYQIDTPSDWHKTDSENIMKITEQN